MTGTELDVVLHDLGYRYVGQPNLYQLTWIEIARMSDGQHKRQKRHERERAYEQGARPSDYEKLDRLMEQRASVNGHG